MCLWCSWRHRYSFSRQIRFLSIIMSLLRRRPWQEWKMFLEFSTCNRSTTKLFSTYLQQRKPHYDWRDRQRQLRVVGFQKRDQILEIMKKLAQTGRERTGRVKGSIRNPRRSKKFRVCWWLYFLWWYPETQARKWTDLIILIKPSTQQILYLYCEHRSRKRYWKFRLV